MTFCTVLHPRATVCIRYLYATDTETISTAWGCTQMYQIPVQTCTKTCTKLPPCWSQAEGVKCGSSRSGQKVKSRLGHAIEFWRIGVFPRSAAKQYTTRRYVESPYLSAIQLAIFLIQIV